MTKKILELSEIRSRLQGRKLNFIAKEAGVSYRPLLRLMSDENYHPRYALIEKLSNYLEGKK